GARVAGFVGAAAPRVEARSTAAQALLDTMGVALAGVREPAAQVVQQVIGGEGTGPCAVIGTPLRASPSNAALANGTAAHALDFDDMCFVSLAHPSAPLVAAALAAGGDWPARGGAPRDAHAGGLEVEAAPR